MSDELPLDLDFRAPAGRPVQVSPSVRRIVADNPGPFTFTGTCTYLVGTEDVAVIDPGPEDPGQCAAILEAVGFGTVRAIVVTHTHRDHSPGARALRDATGAPIVGCGPHRLSRPALDGESGAAERSSDGAHRPDRIMREGDELAGRGWTLTAVETPGHCANHVAYALPEENALFSGDHVMGWSTSIVAPPDGSMSDYMASLDKLRGRPEETYWPGHGGPIRDPQRLVRALVGHRRAREAAILARLAAGDETADMIAAALYAGLKPALLPAARLSVFAHLEDLVTRGRAMTDGLPELGGTYRVTDKARSMNEM